MGSIGPRRGRVLRSSRSTPSNSAMTSSSRAIDLLCRHRRGLGRRARPTRASTASSRTTRRARQLPHALERAARRERARARTPRPPRAWRTPTSSRSRARARGRRVRRAARRAVFPRGGLVSAFAGRRHERVFGEASTRKNGPRRRARALQRGPRPHRRGDRRVAAALRRGGERARDVRGRRRRVRGVGDEAEAPPRPLPPLLRYAADVAECGRVPIYYSAHALEWYRLRL